MNKLVIEAEIDVAACAWCETKACAPESDTCEQCEQELDSLRDDDVFFGDAPKPANLSRSKRRERAIKRVAIAVGWLHGARAFPQNAQFYLEMFDSEMARALAILNGSMER